MLNPATSSPAVMQALQRRGAGAGAGQLSQVSPQAPMANPVPQPANPSSLNKASAPPTEQAPKMPKFEPQNRKDLIVSALVEQLKNENKLDKETADMGAQPVPQAQPAMPQGGGVSLSPGYQQPMARSQMQADSGFGNYSGLNDYGMKGV